MVVLSISMSTLKLGYLVSKTRSPGKSKGHIFFHKKLAQIVVLMISRSSTKMGHLGSNNLVIGTNLRNIHVSTLEVTFSKQSS